MGFSVGHKYKTRNPNDRGASVYGGGWEADYAEMVLEKSKAMLENVGAREEQREIRVVRGDEVLWRGHVDPDAYLSWDPARGVMRIKEE